ncbi:hypothetical protein DCCM_2148 [Desulfocucumis palustris]|uniref:Uncharacterized protein n=1 Tax=Desulfocucumis palustris TaxID=1898651 RepID=A0A2L2XGP1_9FIRM|nr:hypothetical protein DCCM_2148 [Desulfocucumis palustris]
MIHLKINTCNIINNINFTYTSPFLGGPSSVISFIKES